MQKTALDLMGRTTLISMASDREIEFEPNIGTEELREKLREWEKKRGKKGLRPINVKQQPQQPSWQGALDQILSSLETIESRISDLEKSNED